MSLPAEPRACFSRTLPLLGPRSGARLPRPLPNGSRESGFLLEDARGSLRSVVDASGGAKTTFSYTGFGQTTLSGELFPYAFTGRRYLHELGLYDYRSRFYYPWLSRFLQRDPIGIWGDGVGLGNGYAYVGNNPVSRVDPFGLQPEGGPARPESRGRTGVVPSPPPEPESPDPEEERKAEGDCGWKRGLGFSLAPLGFAVVNGRLVPLYSKSQLYELLGIPEDDWGFDIEDWLDQIDPLRHVRPPGCVGPADGSESAESALDAAQTAVDLGSLLDPTPCTDLGNASVYAARGKYGDAAWSAADALLPSIFGGITKIGKNALKGAKAVGETVDAVGDAAKLEARAGRAGSLPAVGRPGSTAAIDRGAGRGTVRDYGPDGRAITDYDFGHDHGVGDPHAHDWDWSKPRPRQPGRPLKPGE